MTDEFQHIPVNIVRTIENRAVAFHLVAWAGILEKDISKDDAARLMRETAKRLSNMEKK